MIKKKLEKHDFSTHEGLKNYIREYVKIEEENSKVTKFIYAFISILFFFGGIALILFESKILEGFIICVLGSGIFVYILSVERQLLKCYKDKIEEML